MKKMNNRYQRRPYYNKNAAIDKKNRIITILIIIIGVLVYVLNYQRETINGLEYENLSNLHEIKEVSKDVSKLNTKIDSLEKPVVAIKPKKDIKVFKPKPKEKLDTSTTPPVVIVDTIKK
jgi:hypothetical protein